MDNQQFHRDGQALPGDLVLPLKLFMPFKVRDQLPSDLGPDDCVHLPFVRLSELVNEAERWQRVMEGTASPSPPPQLRNLKRVVFTTNDGTVTRVEQVAKRHKVDGDRPRTGESSTQPLGRKRSQTRLASQPRRSGRTSSTGASQP